MTKDRDQGSGIRDEEGDRMKQLPPDALPSVGNNPEMDRDLWPSMLRRLDEQTSRGASSIPSVLMERWPVGRSRSRQSLRARLQ